MSSTFTSAETKTRNFNCFPRKSENFANPKRILTGTRDLPISNWTRHRRTRIRSRRWRILRRLLLVIIKLLAHGIAKLKRRQSVAELRNLVVAEPKSQIQTPFELIKIFTCQALGPRQIILICRLHIRFKQNLVLLLLFLVLQSRPVFFMFLADPRRSRGGSRLFCEGFLIWVILEWACRENP